MLGGMQLLRRYNLWLALLALLIAVLNPTVKLPRDIRNYVFVIDITQSMKIIRSFFQFFNYNIRWQHTVHAHEYFIDR